MNSLVHFLPLFTELNTIKVTPHTKDKFVVHSSSDFLETNFD